MYKPLSRRQLPDSEFGLQRYEFGIPVTIDKFSMLAQRYPQGLASRTHLHKHYEAEISFYPDDFGSLLLEGREERFEPGSLFLVGSEIFHHPVFDKSKNGGLLTIYFDPKFLATIPDSWCFINRILNDPARGVIKLPPNEKSAALMRDVYSSFQERKKDWDIVCQGAMLHLVSHFVQQAHLCDKEKAASSSSSGVEMALRYIDLHFYESVDINTCRRIAGLSKSRFCEKFRALTGKTFTDYLLDRRMSYAENLLRNTERQITDIAFSSGFNSISYFSRSFKDRRGCTPKCFRNMR